MAKGTPSLVHVTGRRGVEKSDSVSELIRLMEPQDRLAAILRTRRLEACSTYFSAGEPVVCFTEANQHYLAKLVVEKGHAPWGLVLDYERLRDRGVQPVRYLHVTDAAHDELWRTVRFDHAEPLDWYWEREWRWRGPEPFELVEGDVKAIIIGDPLWPDPVPVPGHGPDGSMVPVPAVPEWAAGLQRFAWDADRGQFLAIGPAEVPAWERVSASATHAPVALPGRPTRSASVELTGIVFTDGDDPDRVRAEWLQRAERTLEDFLSDDERG